MTLLPAVWWPTALLALVLLVDVAMSIRPPKFIRDCLSGVNLPREWWWILVVIKTLAVVGLIVGIWMPGVAFSANVGVIVYFCCASVAHIRARNTTQAFWLNCLGMLAFSVAVLVLSLTL
ncbi:DoxX family protein [Agreia pratensis]|uniref:DoxX-like family protein n=1 Tax=Agreia pratensis TaxID=150121 RepID=A0A1X7KTM4_9MICO|nr:DoxX family protein [Agreia pratensis]MBF4635806.1 DoxX family protein [Agreia pratensis]SMG44756.1 DoxX-like family protein [Agreia pratensis]